MSRIQFYRRVLSYFSNDWPRVALLLLVIAVSTVLGLAAVWPMAILIDTVLAPAAEPPGWMSWLPETIRTSRPAQIATLAASLFLMRISQQLLNAWRGLLNLRVSQAGLMRVRCHLYEKLQALNLAFHRARPQGDSIYRLTSDAAGCQQILGVMIEVLVAIFTLVVMLGVMLTQSVQLTLVALAVVPALLVTNIAFGRVLKHTSRRARRLESDFTATVQRSIASIGLMQAFGRENDEYHNFRGRAADSLDAWYHQHRRMACYRVSIGLIIGVGAAVIFGWGGYQAYHDQVLGHNPDGMTAGGLMVMLNYLGMFYGPLCKISGAGADMLGGVTGMERVFEVLDRDTVIRDRPDAEPLPTRDRALTLHNVSFHYEPDTPVLRDVSASIGPGETVAFVGPSGIGKSTIVGLLCRFFDPTAGGITLGPRDLRDIRLADLRRHVAVVLQENLVLPTTIAENIAYGRPGATAAQVRHAAELAGAAEFIEAMPDGYDSHVNEGGQNLSGGQRQRLAIARALLTEAPVLVLDEPTSALDPHQEHRFTETLANLKGRRTVILISHRLSTITHSDRIFVLHDGRIAERGTHDELLAQRGHYAEMACNQMNIAPEDLPPASPPGGTLTASTEDDRDFPL